MKEIILSDGFSTRDCAGERLISRIVAQRMGLNIHVFEVDHKDRNRLNNQRENLRSATKSQNQANKLKKSGGSSNYKGVYFNVENQKWRARITVRKQVLFLGAYFSEIEAAI